MFLVYLGCAESSLLHGLFSSRKRWGYSLVAVCGLLTVVASRCRAWAPGEQASVVAACMFSSWGSQASTDSIVVAHPETADGSGVPVYDGRCFQKEVFIPHFPLWILRPPPAFPAPTPACFFSSSSQPWVIPITHARSVMSCPIQRWDKGLLPMGSTKLWLHW